jgi:hypothetical protein
MSSDPKCKSISPSGILNSSDLGLGSAALITDIGGYAWAKGTGHFPLYDLRALKPSGPATLNRHRDPREKPLLPRLKWDSARGKRVAWVLNAEYKKGLKPIKRIWPEAYPHAVLMYKRIETLEKYCNYTGPPKIQLISDCFKMGPKCVELYSKAYKHAKFKLVNSKIVFDDGEHLKGYALSFGGSVSTLLAPRFFIYWDEEVDDTSNYFDPYEIDEDTFQSVLHHVRTLSDELLGKDLLHQEPSLFHVYQVTGSNSYVPGELKGIVNWKADNIFGPGEAKHMLGRRSVAPKVPGETRDIITLTPDSRRTLRRLNWLPGMALRQHPDTPYGKEPGYLKKLLLRWGKLRGKKGVLYYRDIAKKGLRVPKDVIVEVSKAFYHRRPELADKAEAFFGNFTFERDGQMYKPTRGHGLGMWEELTTILQLAIHREVCHRSGIEWVQFNAMNDDMMALFRNNSDAEMYQMADEDVWGSLGINLKFSKSGTGPGGFYCEEYLLPDGSLSDKEGLFLCALDSCFSAVNIVHAKQLVNSIVQSATVTPAIMVKIQEIISFWGHEFYPEECEAPYLFGGWVTPSIDGMDASICFPRDRTSHDAAYWAVIKSFSTKFIKGGEPFLALGQLLGISVLLDKGRSNLITSQAFTLETLDNMYRSGVKDWKWALQEYEKLSRERLRIFAEKSRMGVKRDPIPGWILRHPGSFVPKDLEGVTWTTSTVKSPRIISNYPLDYLAYKYQEEEGSVYLRNTRVEIDMHEGRKHIAKCMVENGLQLQPKETFILSGHEFYYAQILLSEKVRVWIHENWGLVMSSYYDTSGSCHFRSNYKAHVPLDIILTNEMTIKSPNIGCYYEQLKQQQREQGLLDEVPEDLSDRDTINDTTIDSLSENLAEVNDNFNAAFLETPNASFDDIEDSDYDNEPSFEEGNCQVTVKELNSDTEDEAGTFD